MDIWHILEIEETLDRRTIKRAYSKKLKTCRPDDDPEAFQQLHEAYTAALEHIDTAQEQVRREALDTVPDKSSTEERIGVDESALVPEQDAALETVSAETDPASGPAVVTLDSLDEDAEQLAVVDDIVADYQQQQEESERLKVYAEQFGETLWKHHGNAYLADWDELLDSPLLGDFQDRRSVGYYLFDMLISLCVEYQQVGEDQYEASFSAPVSSSLLLRLDQCFGWSGQRIAMEEIFDLNGVDYLLHLIENAARSSQKASTLKYQLGQPRVQQSYQGYEESPADEKEKHDSFVLARSAAFALDMTLIVIAVFSVVVTNNISPDHFLLPWVFISSCALYFIAFEASPLRKTPGKGLVGLEVVRIEDGEKASLLRIVSRVLVSGGLLFFYKVSIWINLFFFRQPMLQDHLSRTVVIQKGQFIHYYNRRYR